MCTLFHFQVLVGKSFRGSSWWVGRDGRVGGLWDMLRSQKANQVIGHASEAQSFWLLALPENSVGACGSVKFFLRFGKVGWNGTTMDMEGGKVIWACRGGRLWDKINRKGLRDTLSLSVCVWKFSKKSVCVCLSVVFVCWWWFGMDVFQVDLRACVCVY